MTFTLDEAKAILKHPEVEAWMHVLPFGFEMPKLPPWRYADRDIPVGPFVLLHGCVEEAINSAFGSAQGRERERLLLMLHMVEGDSDVTEIAKEIAILVEDYAVQMQYGADGVASYRQYVKWENENVT